VNGNNKVLWFVAAIWAVSMLLFGIVIRDLAQRVDGIVQRVDTQHYLNAGQERALSELERRINKSPY
jgi:hypothetical protein